MRKPTKSFTVEVKRRPTSLNKKPLLVDAPAPVPEPPAAAVLFSSTEKAPAVAAEPRRILPCLVTDAAIDAAKAAAEIDEAPASRPRGRPRKQRNAEELAPLAPRKRGRPRKTPVEAKEPAPKPVRAPVQPPRQVRPAPALVVVGASARASERRAAVDELPRGERWKRRLPKALR